MCNTEEPALTYSNQIGISQHDSLLEPSEIQPRLFHWMPRPQRWVYIGWFGGIQIVSRGK
jgi:hypothetical protein